MSDKSLHRYPLQLDEDWHVHSTYSDGKGTLEENLSAAEAAGLTLLCFVEHVRKDSDWLDAYIKHCAHLRQGSPLEIKIGVEAKFQDEFGTLDCPELTDEIDYVFAADHRVPLGMSCYCPKDVKQWIEQGMITKERVILGIVNATCAAMKRYKNIVIAHLFSILPKLGILIEEVRLEHLMRIAECARETNTPIEVDERWCAPDIRTASFLYLQGVQLVASTDSHISRRIGKYHHVANVHSALSRFSKMHSSQTVDARFHIQADNDAKETLVPAA